MKPRPIHALIAALSLGALATPARSQVTLTSSPYQQDFDSLATGLPTGWSVRLGATSSGLGTAAVFDPAAYAWSGTAGGFHNYASTDGLSSSASAATQAAAADRALGIRPTSSTGDPGAALVLQVANSLGHRNLTLSFSYLLLDEEGRTVTWTADYGLGVSPTSFVPIGTFTRDVWGAQTQSFVLPAAAENQAEPLWIRLAALNPSTGSGSRDSVAVDDFQLETTFDNPIPEPAAYGCVAGLGLLGYVVLRRRGMPAEADLTKATAR